MGKQLAVFCLATAMMFGVALALACLISWLAGLDMGEAVAVVALVLACRTAIVTGATKTNTVGRR